MAGLFLTGGTIEAEPTSEEARRDAGATMRQMGGIEAIQRTTAQIMADPSVKKAKSPLIMRGGERQPDRKNLPSQPGSLEQAQWPEKQGANGFNSSASTTQDSDGATVVQRAQTVITSFETVTGPTETGKPNPDTQAAVGPSQLLVFIKGRLRTFTRSGTADGVLDANPDVFFNSVLSQPVAGETVTVTDPNVRYDRLSQRWFLNAIDVSIDLSGKLVRPNRVLIAVSDAASNGVISANTIWTFYQFQGDSTRFTDYPSFGIDASALYIGANMFRVPLESWTFSNTKGYIIPKAPALAGSPLTVWVIDDLLANGSGLFSPRGVDNYDPSNTGTGAVGYFIGVDHARFDTLIIRRVTNPGSLTSPPIVSGDIAVSTILKTGLPFLVPHLGNNGGASGRLAAQDDRLFAAHLRNGRLWTAHNIGVDNTGAASAVNATRNGVRWYELQNLGTTPTVRQVGTLFDNMGPNDGHQRNYWFPAVTVSGQGHAALGCSIAGTREFVNAFTTGRLADDALGTMRDGPGGVALPGYTSSSTAYNPPGDNGFGYARRWGDYSATCLDPNDDMTMWTIQQYCNGTNTYGCRVAKLLAPPPATPASANSSIPVGRSSVLVTITGTVSSGSGFFDPGESFPNRISATVSGGVVANSVTYKDPAHVDLNLDTRAASAGSQDVTIINPDGQSRTGVGILVANASATPSPTPTPTPTPTSTPTSTPTPTPGAAATPTLRISVSPASVNEGGSATYTIQASTINPFQATNVHYSMSGKARAGTDYSLTGILGQAEIPAGAASAVVILNASTDSLREKNEKATMTLRNGAGYNLTSAKSARKATVTVTNVGP